MSLANRPTSSGKQQAAYRKRAQAVRPHAPPSAASVPPETYYNSNDLMMDCNSESECETPSDRSRVAKRPATAGAAVAPEYRQNQVYYRPEVYAPSPEYYYGSSPSRYRYVTTPAQTVAPVVQVRKQHQVVPTRQLARVCTAQAVTAPVSPTHQYYPPQQQHQQQYAQSSMVLHHHNDGTLTYASPVPQVTAGSANTVLYQQQQVHRHSTHHMQQAPMQPSSRFRSGVHTSAVNIRPVIPPRKPNSVTVRTPRYIRRPGTGTSTLYKKPSTLCLPLACQPDPAVLRRVPNQQSDEVHSKSINKMQQQPRRSSVNKQDHQVKLSAPAASLTAELQPTLSQSQLDALFANYEELYLKATAQSGPTQAKGKIMATMMGLGPPRVPKHIQKKRQEMLRRANKQQSDAQKEQTQLFAAGARDRGDSKDRDANATLEIPKDVETFDVQEITSQVLQELMCDMTSVNDAVDAGPMGDKTEGDEMLNDTDTTDCTTKHEDKTLIDLHAPKRNNNDYLSERLPESFNYQDIAQNITKSKSVFHGEDEEEDNNSMATQKQSQSHLIKSDAGSTAGGQQQIRRLTSQKSLKCSRVTNVVEAMELHRTKSYVVNLIDTALSNHFGTSVCDKYSSYECSGLNPANLIETLKKHSVPKLEKDVCLEIAQALNQTYSNYNTCPDRVESTAGVNNNNNNNSKQESCCSCKGESTEPTYIKYLRQLRWGHLKHIQAEAKRLEELERFFDSCSKKAFCEKYP